MKNVLLPTDLSVQSLWPIHEIIKENNDGKVSILVTHMVSLPTSISDLLTLSYDKFYRSMPNTFTEAFQMLCHKYKSSVQTMQFRFIYCNTTRYLKNFIEGHNIDKVYLLSNYSYTLPFSQSVNFVSFFNKSKLPVHNIPLLKDVSEYQNLSVLLNNNDTYKISGPSRLAKSTVSYL